MKKTPLTSQYISLMLVILVVGFLDSCAGLRIERIFKSRPEDWTTLGGSVGRTNLSVSPLNLPLRRVWQYDAGAGITSTPLVRDDVLLVCTLKGEMHAVDVRTGKRIGYVTLDGAVAGTPVWEGSTVYLPIAAEDETIEAYDLQNGSRSWRARLGQCESSPLLSKRFLYVTSLNGILYCLDKSSGNEIWKFTTGTDNARKPIRSSPALEGGVIVFGCDDGAIYGVDSASGKEMWKFQTGESVFASPIIVRGRAIVGSLDGILYCLGLRHGELQWSFNAGSKIFGSASSDGKRVFVGTANGTCIGVDADNGTLVWKFNASSVINAAPLIAGNLVCVGSLDKNLYFLDTTTGRKVWQFQADGRIKVPPVAWQGKMFVTSEDTYVTALAE